MLAVLLGVYAIAQMIQPCKRHGRRGSWHRTEEADPLGPPDAWLRVPFHYAEILRDQAFIGFPFRNAEGDRLSIAYNEG